MSGLFQTTRGALLLLMIAVPVGLMVHPAAGASRAAARRGHPVAHPAARAVAALRPVPLPDGSGTMMLPPGWQIGSASKGMVSAAGPQGSVDLGIWVQVCTPETAAQMVTGCVLTAPYAPPLQALQEIAPQWAAHFGAPRFRIRRVLGRVPTTAPNGQGEFMHLELEVPGQAPVQTVALVMTMPTGSGTWIYYYSAVASPSATFARNLPVLKAIWDSWKVSDATLRERLDKALASMKETGRILREAHQNQEEAYDRSNRAWDHTIRGTWVYEDTETGKRYEVSGDTIQQNVDNKNEHAGYHRYKVVPYGKLNRR